MMMKTACQDVNATINVTIGSAITAPTREPESQMLVAKARSRTGNQVATTLAAVLGAGLSPTPSRNRAANSDQKFCAKAVTMVKTDHQTAARAKDLRGPTLSTYHPAASWQKSYAQKKAAKMRPCWVAESSKSLPMNGRATLRLERSR